MPDIITVQLDALDLLAAELATLGADLADDAHIASSCGVSLGPALTGGPGEEMAAVGADWAAVLALLADRAGVVAGTLAASVAGYRELDQAVAALVYGRIGLSAVAV